MILVIIEEAEESPNYGGLESSMELLGFKYRGINHEAVLLGREEAQIVVGLMMGRQQDLPSDAMSIIHKLMKAASPE